MQARRYYASDHEHRENAQCHGGATTIEEATHAAVEILEVPGVRVKPVFLRLAPKPGAAAWFRQIGIDSCNPLAA